jgi:hypothetical protein
MTAQPYKPPIYRGLPEEEICSIEASLGAALPADYWTFLSRSNGQRLNASFSLPVQGQQRWVMQFELEPLVKTDDYRDSPIIGDLQDEHAHLLPAGALIIGFAAAHLTVILFVSGPRRGQVWIKEAERADPDDPEDTCFWVADSFDQF